jgi:hypothetical protein
LTEFLDEIKSPVAGDRYVKRLDLFFRAIELEGADVKDRARNSAKLANVDNEWATRVVIEYMRKQKQRAKRNEIPESTVPNFFKPIELF